MPSVDKPSWKTPLIAMKLAAIFLIGILLIGVYLKSEQESSNQGPGRSSGVSTRIQSFHEIQVDLSPFNLPQAPYLLIGFWASWCPTCKPELKELDRIYKLWTSPKHISPDQFKIVSINVDPPQNAQKVQELWRSLNLSLPLLSLPKGNILDVLKIDVLPSYVLIKDNKMYLLKMDGATPWNSPKIQNEILKYL